MKIYTLENYINHLKKKDLGLPSIIFNSGGHIMQ